MKDQGTQRFAKIVKDCSCYDSIIYVNDSYSVVVGDRLILPGGRYLRVKNNEADQTLEVEFEQDEGFYPAMSRALRNLLMVGGEKISAGEILWVEARKPAGIGLDAEPTLRAYDAQTVMEPIPRKEEVWEKPPSKLGQKLLVFAVRAFWVLVLLGGAAGVIYQSYFRKQPVAIEDGLRRKAKLALEAAEKEDEKIPLLKRRSKLMSARVEKVYKTYSEAAKSNVEIIEMLRRQNKQQSEEMALSLMSMAIILQKQGDFSQAEDYLKMATAVRRSLHGKADDALAKNLTELAKLEATGGNLDAAEKLNKEALDILKQAHGPENAIVAGAMTDLARVQAQEGKKAEAESLYREALDMRRKVLGNEHQDVAASLADIARIEKQKGNVEQAEQLFTEALDMRRKVLGSNHQDVAENLGELARLQDAKGNSTKAQEFQREALDISRKVKGEEAPETAASMTNLALLLTDKGDGKEAEAMRQQALSLTQRLLGGEVPADKLELKNVAALLEVREETENADKLLNQISTMRTKVAENAKKIPAKSSAGGDSESLKNNPISKALSLEQQATDALREASRAQARGKWDDAGKLKEKSRQLTEEAKNLRAKAKSSR